MNPTPITNQHQTRPPWAFPLAAREAGTLCASPVPRWLRVDEGCLWVTPERADAPDSDIWLCAGQALPLPPGSAWVVEACPRASVSLLEAPGFSRAGACVGPAAAPRRRWWQRLAGAARA